MKILLCFFALFLVTPGSAEEAPVENDVPSITRRRPSQDSIRRYDYLHQRTVRADSDPGAFAQEEKRNADACASAVAPGSWEAIGEFFDRCKDAGGEECAFMAVGDFYLVAEALCSASAPDAEKRVGLQSLLRKGLDAFTPKEGAKRSFLADARGVAAPFERKLSDMAWEDLKGAIDKKDFERASKLARGDPSLVKRKTTRGWTPLHAAAHMHECGEVCVGFMRALLDNGADVDARIARDEMPFIQGSTPLLFAASADNYEAARLLIERGADVKAVTASGRTALHTASSVGNKSMVEWLVSHGADVNAKDGSGETPLHAAAQSDKGDVAGFLLRKGADINAASQGGVTALHLAAIKESTGLMRLLLGFKPKINPRDSAGKTPLGWAEAQPEDDEDDWGFPPRAVNPEMVQLLIENGATK